MSPGLDLRTKTRMGTALAAAVNQTTTPGENLTVRTALKAVVECAPEERARGRIRNLAPPLDAKAPAIGRGKRMLLRHYLEPRLCKSAVVQSWGSVVTRYTG